LEAGFFLFCVLFLVG